MVSVPIVETAVAVLLDVLRWGGLPALVALMAVESFGIPPLPSEIILPFAGFLVVEGHYAFWAAVVAALAGGVAGAFAAYGVGRWGRRLLTTGPRALRLDPKHLETIERWFARHGEPTVALCRLLPIVRSYISYPAGTARMEPGRFGLYTAVGALPFTIAFVELGVVLGDHWDALYPLFQLGDIAAVVVLVGLVAWLVVRWHRRPVPPSPAGLAAPAAAADDAGPADPSPAEATEGPGARSPP
ncbi:MAG TPA: DedA family protein [Thermoplasmata archaeon]|nr:DedA family protein [Thermoplasmata archaeon]